MIIVTFLFSYNREIENQTLMTKEPFSDSRVYDLKDSVEYSEGSIVSKVIAKNEFLNLTLFAFDQGQGLSRHTSPYNAMIQVVDGSARIEIGETGYNLDQGKMIIMPSDIPHAVEAITPFKMLLTMFKTI